jgi:hypothetical protein
LSSGALAAAYMTLRDQQKRRKYEIGGDEEVLKCACRSIAARRPSRSPRMGGPRAQHAVVGVRACMHASWHVTLARCVCSFAVIFEEPLRDLATQCSMSQRRAPCRNAVRHVATPRASRVATYTSEGTVGPSSRTRCAIRSRCASARAGWT